MCKASPNASAGTMGETFDANSTNYINLYNQYLSVGSMPKQLKIIHYPRLDTVMMIEDAIRGAKEYPTKAELLRRLPKKVMYQTFNLVLEYLQRSNKIIVTKDGRIVWVFADRKKLRRLLTK
jgi:hypothetical protein